MRLISTVSRVLATTIVASTAMSAGSTPAQNAARDDGVFIVGALHRLHEQEESFTFDDLRRIVAAIRPGVMVLEVRPDELAERKDTPGRPEYPAVIWPLLSESGATAVAMEPGPPQFAELTGQASNEMKSFASRDPDGAKRWSSYQKSLEVVLFAHWRHPADAHDTVTADLSRSYYVMQRVRVGDAFDAVQSRWDKLMVDNALAAIRKAPGKRVLVLCSYRNRYHFEDAIRPQAADRLIEMETWLRDNLKGRAP